VFGHSHIPVNEPGLDGQWLMNPGSATQRRRQPHHTLGVLTVENGEVAGHDTSSSTANPMTGCAVTIEEVNDFLLAEPPFLETEHQLRRVEADRRHEIPLRRPLDLTGLDRQRRHPHDLADVAVYVATSPGSGSRR
jgi:hypothetical protein